MTFTSIIPKWHLCNCFFLKSHLENDDLALCHHFYFTKHPFFLSLPLSFPPFLPSFLSFLSHLPIVPSYIFDSQYLIMYPLWRINPSLLLEWTRGSCLASWNGGGEVFSTCTLVLAPSFFITNSGDSWIPQLLRLLQCNTVGSFLSPLWFESVFSHMLWKTATVVSSPVLPVLGVCKFPHGGFGKILEGMWVCSIHHLFTKKLLTALRFQVLLQFILQADFPRALFFCSKMV